MATQQTPLYTGIPVVIASGSLGANVDLRTLDPMGRSRPPRMIVCATGGALVGTTIRGASVTLPALPNGFAWPVQLRALTASGTTAQGIVGIW